MVRMNLCVAASPRSPETPLLVSAVASRTCQFEVLCQLSWSGTGRYRGFVTDATVFQIGAREYASSVFSYMTLDMQGRCNTVEAHGISEEAQREKEDWKQTPPHAPQASEGPPS
jgi:hypothetical protein